MSMCWHLQNFKQKIQLISVRNLAWISQQDEFWDREVRFKRQVRGTIFFIFKKCARFFLDVLLPSFWYRWKAWSLTMMLHGQNIVRGPIQNFLEAIEVEWYYDRKLEWTQSEKGVEKNQSMSLFAPIRRCINVVHAPTQTHKSMNIFTSCLVIYRSS